TPLVIRYSGDRFSPSVFHAFPRARTASSRIIGWPLLITKRVRNSVPFAPVQLTTRTPSSIAAVSPGRALYSVRSHLSGVEQCATANENVTRAVDRNVLNVCISLFAISFPNGIALALLFPDTVRCRRISPMYGTAIACPEPFRNLVKRTGREV